MKKLPQDGKSLLLRTDFSDDAAWTSLCEAVQQPTEEGFRAFFNCVSDAEYNGLTVEQLVALSSERSGRTFAVIADRETFTNPEQPLLVVDLYDEPGRTFRVIPRQLCGIENNLSISNMDFYEFVESVDPDGVFRGFPLS